MNEFRQQKRHSRAWHIRDEGRVRDEIESVSREALGLVGYYGGVKKKWGKEGGYGGGRRRVEAGADEKRGSVGEISSAVASIGRGGGRVGKKK